MRTYRILLFLLPLILYFAWLLVRVLSGRRPSRFEVSTGLSILLLLYFLAVVGTGIFWVAAQELPVFDWHYLAGYILLLVGAAHVVLHWNAILAFLRKRAPKAMVQPGGARFRPGLRGLGYGFVALLAAGFCFLAGLRFSSQKLTLTTGADDGPLALATGPQEEGQPLESRRLKAAPVTISLARMYHEGCAYPNKFLLPGLTIRTRPAVIKPYPGKAAIPLPEWKPEAGPTVLAAFRTWCAGGAPAQDHLSLDQLSLLLFNTQGITSRPQEGARTFFHRTAPSAGALYPVNVYVSARNVKGLKPGLYYYDPARDALVLVSSGNACAKLAECSGSPGTIRTAPATMVLTTTFARTAFKYRDRAYRYVAMDTGHAAYNLALCAASLGLGAPVVARFDDAAVNHLLDLDPGEEGVLLLQPLGGVPEPGNSEPRFLLAPMAAQKGHPTNFLDLIHGGTSLRLGRTLGPRLTFPEPTALGKGGVLLPEPAQGLPLYQAIRQRRSIRNYGPAPMEQAELSALCRAAMGSSPDDPLLSGTAPLGLYAVVHNVRGLGPGVYRYDPARGALVLIKAGDRSQEAMAACLDQDFCGAAAVVFAKTVDWDDLSYPDGDRGYRYACLRAGFMGEGLYLQGEALGIGVCGVGAFGDDAMAKLLGLDPDKEVCLYVTAAGKK